MERAHEKVWVLTPDEWQRMYEQQNGICAIRGCGRSITATDHNHATGAVRGLLCSGCNTAMGLVAESIPRLYGVIQYLEMHMHNGPPVATTDEPVILHAVLCNRACVCTMQSAAAA